MQGKVRLIYLFKDMDRLVKRYNIDNDIVSADTRGPIFGALVRWTDAKGAYQEELHENDFQKLDQLPIIVGALKRGYHPAKHSEMVKIGSTYEFVLRLQKDENQAFDPRLLELDEIRSQVSNVFPDWTGEERVQHVQRQNDRLRAIAQQFEQEGKRDEAAVAYYNLAYLPGVVRIVGPGGKVQIAGYDRSYDAKSPQRKADLYKAFSFHSSFPQLRCRELIENFDDQRGLIWADLSKTLLREQFITDVEACIRTANERYFSNILHLLSHTYSAVGNHQMACEAMKRLYLSEPRYTSAKEWPSYFAKVTSRATKPLVKGVKAVEGFRCEMPDLAE